MIIILKTLEPFQDSESENDFTSSPSHNVEPEDDEDRPSKVVESLKVKTGEKECSWSSWKFVEQKNWCRDNLS